MSYALSESSKRDFSPGWLAIEVSEKALVKADSKSLQYLKQLQNLQISVVVSHYGEGGSTVQDMFNLPVDAVKFSAQLIERAHVNSDQRRQLAAMIKLVHSRGLVTIADGVKTTTALRMLRTLSCEELQGPLLSKPLSMESIPWARVRT
jgi:EAL domain-containing protein (putative c-di-GMP-specific phosphodiesterase class I)